MAQPRDLVNPPLSTRECADRLGVGTDWIVAAIQEGVRHKGELHKLPAHRLPGRGGRYRIAEESFNNFLRAIEW